MPVVAEVRGWRVVVGGRGDEAAVSSLSRPSRREVVLDARIEFEDGDYVLVWASADRAERDWSRHLSLGDAKSRAERELGIPPEAWRPPS